MKVRIEIGDPVYPVQRCICLVRENPQLIRRQVAMTILNFAQLIEDLGPGTLHRLKLIIE